MSLMQYSYYLLVVVVLILYTVVSPGEEERTSKQRSASIGPSISQETIYHSHTRTTEHAVSALARGSSKSTSPSATEGTCLSIDLHQSYVLVPNDYDRDGEQNVESTASKAIDMKLLCWLLDSNETMPCICRTVTLSHQHFAPCRPV